MSMQFKGEETSDLSYGSARGPIFAVVVVCAFLVLVGRLFFLQIVRGPELGELSTSNVVHFERVQHKRGEIVDRHGEVLVSNRPSMGVYLTPAFLPNARRMLFRLGRALGLPRVEIKGASSQLSEAVRGDWRPFLLAEHAGRDRVETLHALMKRMELSYEAILVRAKDNGEFSVFVNPRGFPSQTLVLNRLAGLLGLDEDERETLRKRIRRPRGLGRYREIPVRKDVSSILEGRVELAIQLGDLPGVSIKRTRARSYLKGKQAAHVLGYVNEATLKEVRAQDKDYEFGDLVGRAGVERAFEDALRGLDGRTTVLVDSKGRPQKSALAQELRRRGPAPEPPQTGQRLALTLDAALQASAEAAFDGLAGTAILMRVHDGQILVMTSTPSYDPNTLAGRFDPRVKRELDQSPFRPWWFRAIQERAAPGSTFKVVTALAALQNNKAAAHEQIFCPGYYTLGRHRFRCWKKHGHAWVNLEQAIAQSCDVYFYLLGRRLGLDPIAHTARELGMGMPTGIEIAGESQGIIPDEAWYRSKRGWYTAGAAVNASIGQGAVTVTPLQVAVQYATIANGGDVVTPQIALRVENHDGTERHEFGPKIRRHVHLDETHRRHVLNGLKEVVHGTRGTARRVQIEGLSIGGKTGTAQVAKMGEDRKKSRTAKWKLRDHAWFVGLAPAEEPEVVVVVFNEHGGAGSKAAAPIARAVIDAWWQRKQEHAQMIND